MVVSTFLGIVALEGEMLSEYGRYSVKTEVFRIRLAPTPVLYRPLSWVIRKVALLELPTQRIVRLAEAVALLVEAGLIAPKAKLALAVTNLQTFLESTVAVTPTAACPA